MSVTQAKTREKNEAIAKLAQLIGDDAIAAPAVPWTEVAHALKRVPTRVLLTLGYRVERLCTVTEQETTARTEGTA